MNKKMLTPIFLAVLSLGLAACNNTNNSSSEEFEENTNPSTHTHSWNAEWVNDETHHWHTCTDTSCSEVSGKLAHAGGTATCVTKAVCDDCGASYGELAGHSWSETYSCSEEGHYKTCTVEGCDAKTETTSHTGGTATCEAKGVCSECNQPYGSFAEHTWQQVASAAYKASSATCTAKATYYESCAVCDEINDSKTFEAGELLDHTGGQATCTAKAVCSVCSNPYGELASHKGGTATCQNKAVCEVCNQPYGELATTHVWNENAYVKAGADGHYHPCKETGCEAHSELEAHIPGAAATETEPQTCTKCGYVITAATGHINANPEANWSGNNEQHWKECQGCDEEAHITEKGNHAGGQATCEEKAVCTTCGLSYGTTLGHDFDYTSLAVATIPTNTANGKAVISCSRCEETLDVVLPIGNGYKAVFELYEEGAKARFAISVEESFVETILASNTELDSVKLAEVLATFSENKTPAELGYSYLLVVNGELVSADFTVGGDNKAQVGLNLLANDKVVFYENSNRVTFGAAGSLPSGGYEFVADKEGGYTFYLNHSGELWNTFVASNPSYGAYTLYVNEVADNNASVTPTGTDFAKFEVELEVDDVVTIKGDETLLVFPSYADATQFVVVTAGVHTFYVNNENKVYVTAPAPEVSGDAMLYLVPNANWTSQGARFAAYFFGNGELWVDMTDSNDDGIYEVALPAGYPSVIFCRMNPSTTTNGWSNKWNQTSDLSVPSDENVKYTVKEGTWDKGEGAWTKLDEDANFAPADNTKWYVRGSINGWTGSDEYMLTQSGEEYVITIELAVGDEIKFTPSATEWATAYGYGNLEDGCKNLFNGSDNIVIKTAGTYTFYIKPASSSIWASMA